VKYDYEDLTQIIKAGNQKNRQSVISSFLIKVVGNFSCHLVIYKPNIKSYYKVLKAATLVADYILSTLEIIQDV
jgi:hypothetical protein